MIGQRISILRKQRGLSQYELAKRLGFSRGKIANYEQGSRHPDYETLQQIADFFEVDRAFLLGDTDNESKDDEEITRADLEQMLRRYKKLYWGEKQLNEKERERAIRIISALLTEEDTH
jgi:transcriptional regulator with XRE-family HTH domain